MKVLYFHQHFSTPVGAAGIRSYEMALRLIARGHQVTMVCGSYEGGVTGLISPFKNGLRRGVVNGIEIIEFDLSYSNKDGYISRTLTFAKFALRSVGIVFTEKYDLVFATTTPLTAGIPGIFARWFRAKPFVFEVRDLWPELPKAMGIIRNPIVLGLMSFLEFISYRSAHRCIGLSPGIVEGIKRVGVSSDRVELIPNGCDISIFSNTQNRWRPSEVKDTDFMAVFAGTHGIANGLDAAIDAAFELQVRKRQDIKIVLIGQGKLKESLKKKALELQLKNVVFQDPINKERLAGLMAGADLGLQILANIPAFYYGTSPNKFFDYIASGLPILNNYPGWLADIITKNDCGFCVPPDSPSAFADALEAAADDRANLKVMGLNASLLAKNEFDRNRLGTQFVSWLEGAMQK